METVYKVIWILRKFIIMRDMFNKRQRFSLRKYSFGVASVLLGVSIFSNAQGAQADETVAPTTAVWKQLLSQMSSWSNQRQQHQ